MIGRQILHYKIIAKLGEGGMGVVYQAEDTKLDRRVALKFLRASAMTTEDEKQRFVREAKAAAAVDHPNVCTVFEINEVPGENEADPGMVFIAMAQIEGQSLKELLEAGQPMAIPDLVDLATQAARGLEAAHDKGIVHRDMKPGNIMVTDKGEVKITDFGLAKTSHQSQMTQEGTTLGTTAYMSPEQARGEGVDHRTDIWAFGVMLFEMIAGRRPFLGDYDQAVIYSILNEEPEAVSLLRSGVPPELGEIVRKCLAKNPEDRYQHTADLVADLNRVRSGLDSPSSAAKVDLTTKAAPARLQNLILRSGALLTLILLVGYLAVRIFSTRDTSSQERLPIAVIDFVNETREPELDGLSGMLITALEQSRRLSVLTRSGMFDILRKLDQEASEGIDEVLGREICRSAGINLMAMATIRRFGDDYIVDLKVLDQQSNRYRVTADARGRGQESIPGLIDELAEQTRRSLQEQDTEIFASQKRVAEVTTINLPAYQHFFRGEELIDKALFGEALAEFNRAINLDSTFGLAYYRLGYAYHLEGDNIKAENALARAMGLLDRIPEKEQYLARAYAVHLPHDEDDLLAGLKILRELEQLYPDIKEMIFFIGDWSYHVGEYEIAIDYLERVLALDTGFIRALFHIAMAYRDVGEYGKMLTTASRYNTLSRDSFSSYLLGVANLRLGRFETALDHLKQAIALEPTNQGYHQELALVYAEQGSFPQAISTARAAAAMDETDAWAKYTLQEVLIGAGDISEAERLARIYYDEGENFHSMNLLAHALVAAASDVNLGVELAQKALKIKPPRYRDRARARMYFPLPEHTLGTAYLIINAHEKAVTFLEAAIELAPLRQSIERDLQEARTGLNRN